MGLRRPSGDVVLELVIPKTFDSRGVDVILLQYANIKSTMVSSPR